MYSGIPLLPLVDRDDKYTLSHQYRTGAVYQDSTGIVILSAVRQCPIAVRSRRNPELLLICDIGQAQNHIMTFCLMTDCKGKASGIPPFRRKRTDYIRDDNNTLCSPAMLLRRAQSKDS